MSHKKEWEAVLILLVAAIAIGMLISGIIDIWTASLESNWSLQYSRETQGWMMVTLGVMLSYFLMRLSKNTEIRALKEKLRKYEQGEENEPARSRSDIIRIEDTLRRRRNLFYDRIRILCIQQRRRIQSAERFRSPPGMRRRIYPRDGVCIIGGRLCCLVLYC